MEGSMSAPDSSTLVKEQLSKGLLERLRRPALWLVVLICSLATSMAVFNSTFQPQSRVDAALANGVDVTVTGLTTSPPGSKLTELKALPGVAAYLLSRRPAMTIFREV